MSTRTFLPRSVPRKYRDTWPSRSSQMETPIASAGAETPAYRAISVFRSCTYERLPVYRRHRGGVGGARLAAQFCEPRELLGCELAGEVAPVGYVLGCG